MTVNDWIQLVLAIIAGITLFVAAITLFWIIITKIIDRMHSNAKQLEREKIKLQKELEHEKEEHVQSLIGLIKEEVEKVGKKVNELTTSFARTDEKLKSNGDIANLALKKIKCFVDATNTRFHAVEKDIFLLKSDKMRSKIN